MDLGAELAQRTDDVPPTPPSAHPLRPRTRGECIDGPRPCPWVSCTEHLIHGRLARTANGSADGVIEGRRMTADDCIAWLETAPQTCTLDVADGGGTTLDGVAEVFGVTRERIRQIESKALDAVAPRARRRHLAEYLIDADGHDPDGEHQRHRGSKHTRAVPAGDREPAPPPADWQGAMHPSQVSALADQFWCAHLLAPMSGALCVARHTSRQRVSAAYVSSTYPVCARCADGAELRARLGDAPAPTAGPDARRHLPVIASTSFARPEKALRVEWFGGADEGDAAPNADVPDESPAVLEAAAPITPDEATVTDSERDESTRSDDANDTTTNPPAKCAVGPCANPVAAVRSDTQKALRECCRKCRLRGHTAMRDGRTTAKNVVTYLTDTFGRTGAAVLAAARAKSPKSPAAPKAPAPAAPASVPVTVASTSLVDRVRDGQRALALAARVGGLDALEQLVTALEGL